MNIFVLDRDPKEAARMVCDKHVVKMPLETAQLLCTVARKNGKEARYKSTHSNHPCTIWVGESESNWKWTVEHGLELCEEYSRRYGREHKSKAVIEECANLGVELPQAGLTEFRKCMPEEYRSIEDVVSAYRMYYLIGKRSIATWKNNKPTWWK